MKRTLEYTFNYKNIEITQDHLSIDLEIISR